MNYSLGQRLEILEVMTAAAELLQWHYEIIWFAFWIFPGVVTVCHVFMCLVKQVLALAAQELSKPNTQKKNLPVVSASTDLSPRHGSDLPVDWRQEVERRIQSKTRRLTKVVTSIWNMGLFFLFALWFFNQPTANFLGVAGCHKSFTWGYTKPLCQPGWSLLFSFTQKLW